MSEPNFGAGDVPIELGGEVHVLRPTLAACQQISKMGGGGGPNVVMARLQAMDFDTVCAVIVAGLGKTAKELPELIYKAGVISFTAPCIRFVGIVNNGGRPLDEEDEDKPEDPMESGSA